MSWNRHDIVNMGDIDTFICYYKQTPFIGDIFNITQNSNDSIIQFGEAFLKVDNYYKNDTAICSVDIGDNIIIYKNQINFNKYI